jgi:hypothetical protein
MAAPDTKGSDETVAMHLDLVSFNVETATRPCWSPAGDDPLIISDELQ